MAELGEPETAQPAVQDAIGIEHLAVTDEVDLACYHGTQSTEPFTLNLPRTCGR
jgi:hypothetical protein